MGNLKQMTKINDICLYADDFEMMKKFYVEMFDFEIIRCQPDPSLPNYIEFDFQGTSLTLWEKTGVLKVLKEEDLGSNGHHFMLAIRVPETRDVDEIYDILIKRGVHCLKEPKSYPFLCRAAYFQDPEQNIWEVFAYLNENEKNELLKGERRGD